MGDPVFADAIAGRAWIVNPAPWAYVEPGWANLFSDVLDRVGAVMARHPRVVMRGLTAKERRCGLRLHTYTRLPPDIEAVVVGLWREAEESSTSTC